MNRLYLNLPTALVLIAIIALVGLMLYLQVPSAPIAAVGIIGAVVSALGLRGAQTTEQIVREASLRPPPNDGNTEVIQVTIPKNVAPPKVGSGAPIPREEPKDVP